MTSLAAASINPMELYHNQVTRAQGSFSLRMFHRSWGIMMIQENISAPCSVLDFPTRESFARELTTNHYDIVGISSIIVNVGKVREMCRMVRELSPQFDHRCGRTRGGDSRRGDDDRRRPHRARRRDFMDAALFRRRRERADPPSRDCFRLGDAHHGNPAAGPEGRHGGNHYSVGGLSDGCNFCTTSAFFGGKGKFYNFYETGDELFEVMCRIEAELEVHSFFVMDENFLLHRTRAMRLLELMKQNGKSWELSVFASANAIRKYTMLELVELGVSWVWMGLESPKAGYTKLQGNDVRQLTHELREHGIRVQGSTIVGLEHHTPDNIVEEIEAAIAHQTDFHQFMLYTPVPGTPLYKEMSEQGRMLPGVDLADVHGQFKFNFKHAAISREDSKRFLDWAFWRDFESNGPSLYRMCQTMLMGWRRYKDHPDPRIRERFEREQKKLASAYNAALWAMEKEFKKVNRSVSQKIHKLRREIENEFPFVARLTAAALGPVLLWSSRREERRLAKGRTYEPPTFVERRNWVAVS